ncbi:MAG: hypothetical protein AAB657_01945 [Patescibacteria group bacterium]
MVTAGACTCSHHMLVCNNCLSIFNVECGPPYSPKKLPPDFTLLFDENMTRISKETSDVGKSPTIKSFGPTLTLEEFKANGCQWPETKNTNDSESTLTAIKEWFKKFITFH